MDLLCATIFVKDMERMTRFYRDGLGLRVLPATRQDGWVELAAGGARLALHAIPLEIAKTIEIATPPEARTQTPIKLVFETTDLAAARERLISQGAVMFEPAPWGGCDGLDPEGNVFQLATRAPGTPSTAPNS